MPWLDAFLDVIDGREVLSVEDPIAGSIHGAAEVERFVGQGKRWVAEHAARVDRISLIRTSVRTVAEFTVAVTDGDRSAVIPIALVVEPTAAELRLRVYYSLWALTGQRIVRAPLLGPDPAAHPAGMPGRYLRALREGDAAACVACYEDDGCLQGASGPAYARCGRATLALEYPRHLVRGGIVLEPCTLTANDERTAVEFNIVRWGDVDLTPQAGLAVYQLGPTGRILANRVYDDVARPWG
jgi:hypothetical protein